VADVHALLPWDLPRRAVHRDLRGNKPLAGALSAITAAVVGVILNLAIWFAVHTIFAKVRPVAWGPLAFDAPVLTSVNGWALLLSLAAVVAMFRFRAGTSRVRSHEAAFARDRLEAE
jgi:chromate transporter